MAFLRKQWFLVSLAIVLAVGLLFPAPLTWLADAVRLRGAIVAAVLFMTALVLNTDALRMAIRHPKATFLAIAVNSAVVPLLAWALSLLLHGELALGLVVTAAAPCTVASAAVWTRRAGGNDAVAILVTVVTNASCFLVTPLWIRLSTGVTGVPIDMLEMMAKLAYLVLAPMALGQTLRRLAAASRWADENKRLLAVLSQYGILTVVLMGAIQCGNQFRGTNWPAGLRSWDIGLMLALVAALHLAALWLAQTVGRRWRLERADWIAAGFAGSQKTLMVGLQVALTLGGGLTILPMVAYHVLQLMIDTIVADRLRDGS